MKVGTASLCLLISLCTATIVTAQTAPVSRRLVRRSPSLGRAKAPEVLSDPALRLTVRNDHVRVFRVELTPHQSTSLYQHQHDFILLALGPSDMKLSSNGADQELKMQAGEMQVLTGRWLHQLVNTADAPLHLIQIELLRDIDPQHPLCGLQGAACGDVRFGKTVEGEYTETTLFETGTVKVCRVELGPGGVLSESARERNYVLVSLTDLALQGEGSAIRIQSGEAMMADPDALRQLKNIGQQSARFLLLELK